jgi:hypothetical protein
MSEKIKPEKPMNGYQNGYRFVSEHAMKVITGLCFLFCTWLFSYILRVEAQVTSFENYIQYDAKFHESHETLHRELKVDLSKIVSSLNMIVTDVRVIQGNRFTSKDAQKMQSELMLISTEMNKVWQEVSKVSMKVNNIETKLNGMK